MSVETKFDVVIVGGGIIGCSIAYFLARDSGGKLKIAVLDKGGIGEEASSGAAGMLAAQVETDSPGPFLDLAIESRKLYGPLSAELKERTGVDIHWMQKGIVVLATTESKRSELLKRRDWQKEMGLQSEWLTQEDVSRQFPFLESSFLGALIAAEDGQVASSRVVSALSAGSRKMGVEFFDNEEVTGFEVRNGVVQFAHSKKNRIAGSQFVIAAGSWSGNLLKNIIPIEPVKGQILFFEMHKGWSFREEWETPVFCGTGGKAKNWNCYLVPKKDDHLLVGATMEWSGFEKSENKIATEELREYAGEILPDIKRFVFKGVWVGFRPGTPDRSPILGLAPGFKNLFAACGHFRNGILLAPVTGKIISELILHGESFFPLEPFSPSRFAKN